MGLHPGLLSKGCLTVKVGDGTPRSEYNKYNCWQKMSQVIDSGDMTYNDSKADICFSITSPAHSLPS